MDGSLTILFAGRAYLNDIGYYQNRLICRDLFCPKLDARPAWFCRQLRAGFGPPPGKIFDTLRKLFQCRCRRLQSPRPEGLHG